MLFQIRSYLKFWLKSTNQHGLHSPFVYKLVTEVFYDKTKKNWYPNLKNYRNTFLKNHQLISVQDFGAGSKKLGKQERQISKIAKNAGISQKRAELLGRINAYFKPQHILEIGTSLGLATVSLGLSNPQAQILSLEGCPNTAAIASKQLKSFGLHNIDLLVGNFNKTLKKAFENKSYELIYFDGNHQKEATISYFEQALKAKNKESIFIFDDIYWSKGMQEAWQHIKEHPQVTVSIDTFYWGMVFFRSEQEKQHFTIRI